MSKFAIVSLTRTGSTMLDSAFNNCTDISSFGECMILKQLKESFLNSKREKIRFLRQYHFKHSLYSWYKSNNPNCGNSIKNLLTGELIQNWYNWLYSLNLSVGQKILWESVNEFNSTRKMENLQDIIKRNNIKIIYLSRNINDRIKSIRNKWKWNHIRDEELREMSMSQENDLLRWFPNHLKVTYEELTGNENIKEFPVDITRNIFNYLELSYQPLKPMIEKTIYDGEFCG